MNDYSFIAELWAGIFYLGNKIFMAFSEGKSEKHYRTLRILAWSSYLIGLPGWLIIFLIHSNWILFLSNAPERR